MLSTLSNQARPSYVPRNPDKHLSCCYPSLGVMMLSIVRGKLSNVEKKSKTAPFRVTCKFTEAGLHHRSLTRRRSFSAAGARARRKRHRQTIHGSSNVQARPREHHVSRVPPSTFKDSMLVGLRGEIDRGYLALPSAPILRRGYT